MGRFARGKGARSYEARFSPSRSPFPGTSLFCAVVWSSVLVNACMLLYRWRQAEPIFLSRRTGKRPAQRACSLGYGKKDRRSFVFRDRIVRKRFISQNRTVKNRFVPRYTSNRNRSATQTAFRSPHTHRHNSHTTNTVEYRILSNTL